MHIAEWTSTLPIHGTIFCIQRRSLNTHKGHLVGVGGGGEGGLFIVKTGNDSKAYAGGDSAFYKRGADIKRIGWSTVYTTAS